MKQLSHMSLVRNISYGKLYDSNVLLFGNASMYLQMIIREVTALSLIVSYWNSSFPLVPHHSEHVHC